MKDRLKVKKHYGFTYRILSDEPVKNSQLVRVIVLERKPNRFWRLLGVKASKNRFIGFCTGWVNTETGEDLHWYTIPLWLASYETLRDAGELG